MRNRMNIDEIMLKIKLEPVLVRIKRESETLTLGNQQDTNESGLHGSK